MRAKRVFQKWISLLLLILVAAVAMSAQTKVPKEGEIDTFVRIEVSKNVAHVSDTLRLTYWLYTTYEVERVLDAKFPSLRHFYATTIPSTKEVKEETVKGKLYRAVALRTILIQPTKSGTFELPQGMILLQYALPTGQRQRDFFGNIFDVVKRIRKQVEIEPITIRVHDYQAA